MAAGKKIDSAKAKTKGVAFGKWAKIDRAQRNMFLAVCGASVILGITIVGVIQFSKTIAFNAKLITEKDKVIKDYVSIQNSLKSISDQIGELTNNENLEVVARTRANDCVKMADSSIIESDSIEDIEVARTCTALRVIPDAMPSSKNEEATLSSMNQLLLWSNGGTGVGLKAISGDSNNVSASPSMGEGSTMSNISLSLSLNDEATRIKGALSTIEDSIRNYDISDIKIQWSGDEFDNSGVYIPPTIEVNGTFNAYYSNPVSIEKQSKKICADDQSEKCTGRKKK